MVLERSHNVTIPRRPRCVTGLSRYVTAGGYRDNVRVCPGLPGFVTICHDLSGFVTICPGLPGFARICPGPAGIGARHGGNGGTARGHVPRYCPRMPPGCPVRGKHAPTHTRTWAGVPTRYRVIRGIGPRGQRGARGAPNHDRFTSAHVARHGGTLGGTSGHGSGHVPINFQDLLAGVSARQSHDQHLFP